MQTILLGSGTVTSRLGMRLNEQGHTVAAQISSFTPQHMDLFDFQAIVAVAPECSVLPESLVRAIENGKMVFVIAGTSDGLAAWSNGVGIPAFAYPPSDVDTNKLFEEMRRAESSGFASDEQYRRTVMGSDMSARIQSGMAIRKIAVTSPKGGTGKTTVAVNLAVAFALCGITTYLVDADGNAGALQYHLRLDKVSTTMMGLLRREVAQRPASTMAAIASGGNYLNAFTPVDNLPTLKVLPGLVTDDLGDEVLQNETRITEVINGLYEAGVATGGVVIMDVGINPAHVVHRAALRAAEGIAIVIKPEIPDLAETRRWLARMILSLSNAVGKMGAYEFVGSRVKLCYNQVIGDGFKSAHRMLQEALREDKIDLALTPNGILPIVPPLLAAQAVNTERREDILLWRYRKDKLEELGPFSDSLIGFAAHFVPAIREGAARIGLLQSAPKSAACSEDKGLFDAKIIQSYQPV